VLTVPNFVSPFQTSLLNSRLKHPTAYLNSALGCLISLVIFCSSLSEHTLCGHAKGLIPMGSLRVHWMPPRTLFLEYESIHPPTQSFYQEASGACIVSHLPIVDSKFAAVDGSMGAQTHIDHISNRCYIFHLPIFQSISNLFIICFKASQKWMIPRDTLN
jgi:hypothetical protein